MPKTLFVRDLQPDAVITSFFLVQAKELRQKKSGDTYISLILSDRTGEIEAKMWDNVGDVVETFDRDDFVKIKGLVQVYHNRPQLTIHKLRRLQDAEVNLADYLPHTRKNIDEMWAELRAATAAMANPYLRALLDTFLNDEEIASRYRIAPAAKTYHHATLGGLLEHVVSLLRLARVTAQHYPFIDYDLLVTGVVLHDVGKIYELDYERSFRYSTDGQLLGHIIIGLQMVQAKAGAIEGFPPKLRTLVEHMILGHHGQYDYGSPKLPMFPEALLLHYLDVTDSMLESMRASIENDRTVEGEWTAYNSALGRTVLKKEKYLSEEPAKSDELSLFDAPVTIQPVENTPGIPQGNGPAPAVETVPGGPSQSAPAPAANPAPVGVGTPAAAQRPPRPGGTPAPPRKAAGDPRASGLFAEKLQSALKNDHGNESGEPPSR